MTFFLEYPEYLKWLQKAGFSGQPIFQYFVFMVMHCEHSFP